MKDSVLTDIGAKEPLQDWASIDWQKVNQQVKNLRQRIYRATQEGQWNKVRSLTKLMLRSYSNFNGEELHTHHKVPIQDGGTDQMENLVHLHKTCHKHLHQMSVPLAL